MENKRGNSLIEEKIKELKMKIAEFCELNYGEPYERSIENFDRDFPDLSNVGIAYTENEFDQPIQFGLDLVNFKSFQEINHKKVELYNFLEEAGGDQIKAIQLMIQCIDLTDFDTLVSVEDEDLERAGFQYGEDEEEGKFIPIQP